MRLAQAVMTLLLRALGKCRAARRALSARRARFALDESGAFLVFSLFILVLMLIASGMAIDFMHFENTRTRMQATLDRSILAAASLSQTLNPKDVVADYFAKAGLSKELSSVTVDQGINYRQVSATAGATVNSMFLNMVGIKSLAAHASGQAEERVNKVEISLVLDVSGSMSEDSKLSHLKTAAKEFIDTVVTPGNAGKVSVSIIPFSTQVDAGARLLSFYNVSNEQTVTNCINFQAADFDTAALSQTAKLQRTGNFDPWSYSKDPILDTVCPTSSSREILAFSQNASALKAKINALQAGGNTSIDIGMKWGAALLDPGTQPVVSGLINAGVVDAAFAGRPLSYSDPDALKIAVVMTDGHNTPQYYLNTPYSTGNSEVWRDPDSGRYSIYYPPRRKYYIPSQQRWRRHPYGGSRAKRLSYPQLWSRVSIPYNAYYFHYYMTGNWNDYYNWYYNPRSYVSAATKDSRLESICSQAKSGGVTIFTIAFETTSADANVMKNCATSDADFYDVNGIDISTAFNAIAKTISKLRLTQ